jgi:ferric-dicitrate binding protein FerR (iron transport regulator)
MNLTDREILELNELCNAVIDDTLTDTQRTRLTAWLSSSEDARQYYVRALGQSASLHTYASEVHAEAPGRPLPVRRPGKVIWLGGLAAVAAAVAIAFWVSARRGQMDGLTVAGKTVTFVARLSAAKEVSWAGNATLQPGALLRKGQRLDLASGYAEVTFDSGARVVLQGSTSFVINSAWDATLRKGTLKASVPPQAIGFRVSNPSVEVTDLGTEFTMIADASGATDVLVLKGEVEAAPRASADSETILLREREARRFESTGVSEVSDSEEKFARFDQTQSLERFTADFHYAHWSFDEKGGGFSGHYTGAGARDLPALLQGADTDAAHAVVAGQWRQALKFDGQLQAQTSFPGISELSPHTVSFWVRVPDDAPLSDSYAMVAWRSGTAKLSYRPIHISWNRNPNEGALGALRTDFSGGCALGTTSLRDGRWHHVAVVITPSEDSTIPVQVRQYVDGRLESSTIIPGKFRGPAGAVNASLNDLVWLGCRLGNSGPRQERFRGEIDELYIADRALAPQEIVQVMSDNRVPSLAVAAASPL